MRKGRGYSLYYVNAQESCAMTFTCCMQQYPSEIKATAETDVEFCYSHQVMDGWIAKYPTWKKLCHAYHSQSL